MPPWPRRRTPMLNPHHARLPAAVARSSLPQIFRPSLATTFKEGWDAFNLGAGAFWKCRVSVEYELTSSGRNRFRSEKRLRNVTGEHVVRMLMAAIERRHHPHWPTAGWRIHCPAPSTRPCSPQLGYAPPEWPDTRAPFPHERFLRKDRSLLSSGVAKPASAAGNK